MIQECMQVFRSMYEKEGLDLILSKYILSKGTYVLVDGNWKEETIDISGEKEVDKKHPLYKLLCHLDFYGKTVASNKNVGGPKLKVIKSNNFRCFFTTKQEVCDGKITKEIIGKYFHTLKEPDKSFQKKRRYVELYEQVSKRCGLINRRLVDKCREYTENYFENLVIEENQKTPEKTFIKLFFLTDTVAPYYEGSIGSYEKEAMRYLLMNLTSTNHRNVKTDDKIYGVPYYNTSMNLFKPYTVTNQRKNENPILLSIDDLWMYHLLMMYLLACFKEHKPNIYIDTEKNRIIAEGDRENSSLTIKHGYFLRVSNEQLGFKVVHIESLVNYHNKIPKEQHLIVKHYTKKEFIENHYEKYYKTYTTKYEILKLIDNSLFDSSLLYNRFRDAEASRYHGMITHFLYVNDFKLLYEESATLALKQSKEALIDGRLQEATYKLDLVISLELAIRQYSIVQLPFTLLESLKEKVLEKENTEPFYTDQEYAFALGQACDYLLDLAVKGKQRFSKFRIFFNVTNDKEMKKHIMRLFNRYGYKLYAGDDRMKRLIDKILAYKTLEGIPNRKMFLLGVLTNNVMYQKLEPIQETLDQTEDISC